MAGDSPAEPARALSSPEISIPVSAEDAKTGFWLNHRRTHQLLWGGGSLAMSAVVALAMAWGDSLLDHVKGAREDVQAAIDKIDARMVLADQERRALLLSDAAKTEGMRALDARIQAVETKCEAVIFGRYERSLKNYERRHGIEPEPDEAPDRAR